MPDHQRSPDVAPLMCSRCVMRSVDDPDLQFVDSVCNHCRRYDELLSSRVSTGNEARDYVKTLVASMQRRSGKRRYDCVVGVSGGVDSTYIAYIVKELGLRPLAVHVDNGWNSETAVANIERTLKRLDIDLHTEVLDLREFYDLQRAFLLASTPDGDIPTDHAIQATLWKVARRDRIPFIISGMNFRTESMSVPAWSYGHSDWRYIRAVHRVSGQRKLRTFPHFGFIELAYTTVLRRVRIVSLLNYLDYNKQDAIAVLKRELGWQPYGGKHYESIYTRFYQGYVMPTKFAIDKRRGHLSDLINSGQISRAEALKALEHDDYDDRLMRRDRDLFLKKLNLTQEEFEQILATTPKSFRDYPNSYETVQRLRRLVNRLRGVGWYPK